MGLRRRYRWPKSKPDVPPKLLPTGEPFGWFHGDNRWLLQELLDEKTDVILELGAFLGLSTKYLAEYAPAATVVTIDHWQGSKEHVGRTELLDVIDRLFETFCVHLWEYRDRVIPMRTTTIAGMISAHDFGLIPSLIYVDAAHETGPVFADTMLALTLWPDAHIVGDDASWTTIKQAHRELSWSIDREIVNYGNCWEIPPKGTPATWPDGLKAKKA